MKLRDGNVHTERARLLQRFHLSTYTTYRDDHSDLGCRLYGLSKGIVDNDLIL